MPSGVTASWGWSVSGAVVGGDFVGTTRNRVAIVPGASSASFPLGVRVDGVAELAEVFEVSLHDGLLAKGRLRP